MSHAEWLGKHQIQVKAAGRVLRFLGLAEPDQKSDIGWRAKRRFVQIAKKAELQNRDPNELSKTKHDEVLFDMLEAIAIGVFKGGPPAYDLATHNETDVGVQEFNLLLLSGLGLIRLNDHFDPIVTPLLRELFVQGAVQIQKAASASS
jgi:hypothetical protein